MGGESSGENHFEIFQIYSKYLQREILSFAHLHLIDIHGEPLTYLVLIMVLKMLTLRKHAYSNK